jgi:YVTN family beta-propeller protein
MNILFRHPTGRRMLALAFGGLSLVLTHLAWATPFAYISNSGSDTVSVIDTATNTVTTTIPVDDTPLGVAVTPDGSRVSLEVMTGKRHTATPKRH